MNPESDQKQLWNKAKEIVADAMELPIADRDRLAIARCGDQHGLLREVRSLLAYASETASFIDKPGAFASAAIRATVRQGPQREWQNEVLGAWQLDHEIGRGGMGMVYLAHRADGAYQQIAAIKLLRGDLGGPNDARSRARMQRERQTLAELSHPNIARLLDGGNASDGTPYLVMEYIKGEAIDSYCNGRNLSNPERIELMLAVCAAVQSAHQRLVIHRDLKPSNVLVSFDGVPKLLDFGVARLLESQGDDIEQTQGALLFTPRYASPEQVRGLAVSVATDVYGLGLLLYELLAGESPYERLSSISTNAATNAAAAMQVVMSDVLRKPSDVARLHRQAHAGALRGDLDTILLKASAKNARERYQTVAELSADLKRYLQNRPIAARSPTWAYVAKKFARRHAIGVGFGAVAAVAVAAGFTGTLVQKNHAEIERANADLRYSQVRQIANSFIFKYYTDIETLPGSGPILKDMTSDGLKFLDYLYVDAATNPQLSVELGAGYGRLANVLYNGRNLGSLGDKAASASASAKAHALLDGALLRLPNDSKALYEMARLESNEAALLGQEGDPAAALAKSESAITHLQTALTSQPANYDAGYQLPQAYLAAAMAKGQLKQPAGEYLDKADAAIKRWAALNENDPEAGNLRLYLLRRQYLDAQLTGDYPAAIRFGEQEIKGYDAQLKGAPHDFIISTHLQTALLNRGGILNILKQPDEALIALNRGLEVSRAMLTADPKSIVARKNEARIYFHRAKAWYSMGRKQLAFADFIRSTEDYRFLDGKDLASAENRQRGEALWWLAKLCRENNDHLKLQRSVRELLTMAAKYPDVFAQPPAAGWVEEAKRLAGI